MKTNIEIDQKLLEAAMKISGNKTIEATIETGLELILLQNQRNIRSLRGKLKWEGDLDQMRTD